MNWNNNTNIIGKSFLEFDILSSTNLYAISKLKSENLDEGTVIFAHGQSDGRGQRGTTWESNSGENILLSIVLKPNKLLPTKQFILNKIISLAVFDFVKMYLPNEKVAIKWPNDIYVNQQKIAGILIQNIILGHQIATSVVGIGININQVSFSENLNAISFKSVQNKSFKIKAVLQNLFYFIEFWYLKLQNKKEFEIDHYYLSRLYKKGENAAFKRKNDEIFDGIITGVDEIGRLKIQTQKTLEVFDLKEISFLS